MERIQRLLRELPLFESFTPEDLASLIAHSRLTAYAPQETIIAYGQPGRDLIIIVDGAAEVVVADARGERQRIAERSRGDFLGEISLLTGEPTTADVIALQRCETLRIPQDTFSTYLSVNPAALRVMAKTITERLRWRELDEAAQARVEDAWRRAPDPYGLELSTAQRMRVLTIECTTSSVIGCCFDTSGDGGGLRARVDGLDSDRAVLSHSAGGDTSRVTMGPLDHKQAIRAIAQLLTDPAVGVIGRLDELDAVGHRVAHGADHYGSAALIDERVLHHIKETIPFAPFDNPINLAGIEEASRLLPTVPQVAVFDTAFHQHMPIHAYLYGLPYTFLEHDRIRRYGSHGISHQYAALQAAAHLGRGFRGLQIITCHLDGEASACAIDHGRSIDTSTGLAPLAGLIMSSRSGDLDPAVIIHLLREKAMLLEDLEQVLYLHGGLKGISGVSGGFRELEDAANNGDPRAMVAIQTFCYQTRRYIGAYIAAMSGLDALVFTGHIGEGSAWVRSLVCQGLGHSGVLVDDRLNKAVPPRANEITDISADGSPVRVLVVPADDARMIARETIRTLGYQVAAQVSRRREQKQIPVEVSAHHVHLSGRDVDALFGAGYQLTYRTELSQPGQFACQETVDLVGPRGRVERVRILGPVRRQTQVEIAMTEEFRLGIKAPIRASGDLEGTPGITLAGPRGALDVSQGVICCVRHIHMSPEDALSFGLKDRDICMVRVEGERTLIFGDILVRVSPDYRLAMHIDTDEANAANIRTGMPGYLVSVEDRRVWSG